MLRSFVTPEGVDLRLELGSAGARAGAFMLDATMMIAILIVMTVTLAFTAVAAKSELMISRSCGCSASSSFATAGSRCSRWAAAAPLRARG
jgi:hypothetical protein